MDKRQETIQTWDKVAQLYQETFMDLPLYDHTYDQLCALLPQAAHIFEIGCGPGNITKYLLSKQPDCTIDAIDTSPRMIELARVNNPSASFFVMNCRQIDSIQTQYDAVVCGFCLPYLSEEDCAKLVSDCKNILHDNGIFYLSFVEGAPSLSGYQTGSSGDRMYFYYHELANLQDQLKANGFKVVQLLPVDYPKKDGTIEVHTVVIAQLSDL